MIKVTFLGVDGYPQGGRETISILVEIHGYRILLDCGASIIHQLDRYGLMASDIDAVFISHLHADHSSGLPLLLYSNVMERFEKRASNKGSLAILGDQTDLEPIISYCKSAYPNLFNDNNFVDVNQVNVDVLKPTILKENITVEGAPIKHAVQGLSISLTIGNYKICYTSDTRCTDNLEKLAKGSNLLICNVFSSDDVLAERFGFLSASEAAKLAFESGVEKLAMIHLSDDVSKATEIAKCSFQGIIITPTNGDSIMIE